MKKAKEIASKHPIKTFLAILTLMGSGGGGIGYKYYEVLERAAYWNKATFFLMSKGFTEAERNAALLEAMQ